MIPKVFRLPRVNRYYRVIVIPRILIGGFTVSSLLSAEQRYIAWMGVFSVTEISS